MIYALKPPAPKAVTGPSGLRVAVGDRKQDPLFVGQAGAIPGTTRGALSVRVENRCGTLG